MGAAGRAAGASLVAQRSTASGGQGCSTPGKQHSCPQLAWAVPITTQEPGNCVAAHV